MLNNKMPSEKVPPSILSQYDPLGIKEVWNTTLHWGSSGDITRIVVSGNEVYVIGYAMPESKIYIEKLDDFGNWIWRQTWSGGDTTMAYDAVVVESFICRGAIFGTCEHYIAEIRP